MFFFEGLALFGQGVSTLYKEWIVKAEGSYERKDYAGAAKAYSQAFQSLGWKGLPMDRYNAACSWALAGNSDSAFYQLNRMVDLMDFVDYPKISSDEDFIPLYQDQRWGLLLEKVKKNKQEKEKDYRYELVTILDSVFKDDQEGRLKLRSVEEMYGRNSAEVKQLWKEIEEKDSINLLKVSAILDTHGWLGPEVVGNNGNSALFLVIQHSPLQVQLKYIPMLRAAVKAGKARPSSLALMEDRVALRQGKKQIYGSQIGTNPATGIDYVQPLEDPDHVDERRAEVGLQPLADYVKNWNLVWDVEQYKKDLPALEALEKEIRKQ
jgi:hypothetical protein